MYINVSMYIYIPIGSVYAIYGNMDPINIPQMLAYIPYMDPMGYIYIYMWIYRIEWDVRWCTISVFVRIFICLFLLVSFQRGLTLQSGSGQTSAARIPHESVVARLLRSAMELRGDPLSKLRGSLLKRMVAQNPPVIGVTARLGQDKVVAFRLCDETCSKSDVWVFSNSMSQFEASVQDTLRPLHFPVFPGQNSPNRTSSKTKLGMQIGCNSPTVWSIYK